MFTIIFQEYLKPSGSTSILQFKVTLKIILEFKRKLHKYKHYKTSFKAVIFFLFKIARSVDVTYNDKQRDGNTFRHCGSFDGGECNK